MDRAILTAIKGNKLFEPRALAAIIATETSGKGFDSKTGKIIIRFEVTYFKHYNGTQDFVAPCTQNTQEDAWKIFDKAYALNKEAALYSTSIGLGQILGINYSMMGFKDVEAMWDNAKTGIAAQVEQLVKYIASRPILVKAVKKHDWSTFAKYYNGPLYKENNYDTKLATNYSQYKDL